MRNETIEIKALTEDGEYLDLVSQTLICDYESVVVDDYVVVDKSFENKLDMVAKLTLGSVDDVDILMNFNKLINPYVTEGQIIAIPNKNSFKKHSNYIDYKHQTVADVSLSTSPVKKQTKTKNYTNNKGVLVF